VEERVSEPPPAGVRSIYATMWDCMRGGGREESVREREGGRGGGRERGTTLRQNHSTSTVHQSIDTRSKTLCQ
jgi:hypothetical protein